MNLYDTIFITNIMAMSYFLKQNRGHLIGVQQQQQEVMKTTAPIQVSKTALDTH